MSSFGWILLVPLSLALAVADLRTFRLPNTLVGLAFVTGVVCLRSGFAASLMLFAGYFALHCLSRGGLGMGDVKLAAVIGLYAGSISTHAVLMATWLAFILGGLYALIAMARKKVGRGTHIPFGPFMLAGLWLTPLVLSR